MPSDQDTTSDRVDLSIEQALARLPEKERIHTFRVALVGTDWDRDDVIAAMQKYGVEEAGAQATATGHGMVIMDERGPLFIETRPENEVA